MCFEEMEQRCCACFLGSRNDKGGGCSVEGGNVVERGAIYSTIVLVGHAASAANKASVVSSTCCFQWHNWQINMIIPQRMVMHILAGQFP